MDAVHHRTWLENEKHEEELSRKVAEATLAQVSSKLKADLEQLTARSLDKTQEAVQAAKDIKYIKERQRQLRSSWQYDEDASCG